jgi:protein-tyrosine phosphatase
MTSHHASTLRRLASTVGADTSNDDSAGLVDGPIIRMYRSFDPDQPPLTKWQSESVLDVDDPWYGGPSDFEACLSEIEDASTAIVDYVKVQLAAR